MFEQMFVQKIEQYYDESEFLFVSDDALKCFEHDEVEAHQNEVCHIMFDLVDEHDNIQQIDVVDVQIHDEVEVDERTIIKVEHDDHELQL